MTNQFKFRIFFSLTIVLVILTFATLWCIGSVEENDNKDAFVSFGANLYSVFRFPTHFLFAELIKGWFLFALGLLINCTFYGLVGERIYSTLAKKYL